MHRRRESFNVSSQFPDVPANQWYSAAIAWCSANGVVTGYGDTGLFQPNAPVTREQLTTMIFRYCVEMKGQSPRQIDLSRFSDRGRDCLLGA